MNTVNVIAVSRKDSLLVLDDGSRHAVLRFLDWEGDDIAAADARFAVAELPVGWICVDLNDFVTPRTH